jgi:hypothetical protein
VLRFPNANDFAAIDSYPADPRRINKIESLFPWKR